jgi:hypothetical protein
MHTAQMTFYHLNGLETRLLKPRTAFKPNPAQWIRNPSPSRLKVINSACRYKNGEFCDAVSFAKMRSLLTIILLLPWAEGFFWPSAAPQAPLFQPPAALGGYDTEPPKTTPAPVAVACILQPQFPTLPPPITFPTLPPPKPFTFPTLPPPKPFVFPTLPPPPAPIAVKGYDVEPPKQETYATAPPAPVAVQGYEVEPAKPFVFPTLPPPQVKRVVTFFPKKFFPG